MDTVILTNDIGNQKNEPIKVIVNNNQADPNSPKIVKTENEDCGKEECTKNANNVYGLNINRKSSVKTGCTQTTVDFRGQGDFENISRIQKYATDKKIIYGKPGFIQKQNAAADGNVVSHVSNTIRNQDVLEEMKRKVSLAFMKQQAYQRATENAKSSYVPGTDYEYRTPGAHFKNKNGKIKRPMNAFMVWARDYRGRLASSMLNATNSEISVKLGQIWASMPAEEKQQYYDVAEKIKAKHRQDYPDWVYQPSAQALKKKDEVQVFMRTPTPPPISQLLRAKLGLGGPVMDDTPADKFENQENVVSSDQSTDCDSGQNNSPGDPALDTNPQPDCLCSAKSVSETSACSSPAKPIYVARVSHQPGHTMQKETNVSNSVKSLLASKLSNGRLQIGPRMNLPPETLAKLCFQQRPPLIRKLNIPPAAPNGAGLSVVRQSTIRPIGLLSPDDAKPPTNYTPPPQPRILGIMTSTALGRLPMQSNVRVHAVRPTLLRGLLPNTHLSPNLIPYKQHTAQTTPSIPYKQHTTQTTPSMQQNTETVVVKPKQEVCEETTGTPTSTPVQHKPFTNSLQNQTSGEQDNPVHCVAKDIPIVETSISPISTRVRPAKPCSNNGDNVSKLAFPLLAKQVPPKAETDQSSVDDLQTITSADGNVKYEEDFSSKETQKGSCILPQDFESIYKKDVEDDGLWPFPFSENPANWDVKEVPSAFYMELFDPYDPFLNADSLLSDTFPGSLQLDVKRWKQYLEDDDSDPLKSLKNEKADDIIPSPLPLKQTLCRLLNARVQESDTGDIITGDLVLEANSADDTSSGANNDNDDNFEFDNKELLTTEMAIEISRSLLRQTENYDKLQNVNHILNSILDTVHALGERENVMTETGVKQTKREIAITKSWS